MGRQSVFGGPCAWAAQGPRGVESNLGRSLLLAMDESKALPLRRPGRCRMSRSTDADAGHAPSNSRSLTFSACSLPGQHRGIFTRSLVRCERRPRTTVLRNIAAGSAAGPHKAPISWSQGGRPSIPSTSWTGRGEYVLRMQASGRRMLVGRRRCRRAASARAG
jgi:hypothetical protein